MLQAIPPQVWARTFLIMLVFLGGSLVMAGLTAAIGINAVGSATGLGPVDGMTQVFDGGPSWWVVTFQILAMGFLSPLSIGMDITIFEGLSGGGSLFFVPWLVPAGGIIAVAATQRHIGRNLRTPHTGTRFLLAGLAGLVFATIVTVLAATVRFRFIDDFETGSRLWAHAASLPGFLVSAVVVGFMTYLLLMPQRGQLLQRVMTGIAHVFEHVLTLAVLGAVALLIAALVSGETEAALLIVFALPTMGLMAASMVHFVPTVMSGSENMTGTTGAESMTMFALPTVAWILAIVVMLVVLCVSAFRWGLRAQFHAHAAWSWITLTVTYVLVGVLITAANGLYFSAYMAGEGVQASIRPAAWGFLIWLLVGVVVQALASYIMPRLTYRMPTGLVRTLGIGLTLPPAFAPAPQTSPVDADEPATQSMAAVEQTAVMAPVANSDAHIAASAEPGPPAPDPWSAPAPASRDSRPMTRKSKVVLISGLSLLALVALAWIAHTVVDRTVFSPRHTAEEYLQAVVDGRAEDALQAMGPNVTDELRALATDEIYQAATDRPDRFELGDVHRDGSEATVEATMYQSGKAYPLELGLTTSGRQAVVFSDWSLEAGDVAGRAVYTSGPSQLTVNDVETEVTPSGQGPAESSAATYNTETDETAVENLAAEMGQVLLPGTYTFAAPQGSTYLSNGEDLELTVTPGEVSTTPIEFSQRYTAAFEEDAVAQVEQRLESCLEDNTIRIADCEAASWEDTSWNAMSNMERIWERSPEIELVPAESEDVFAGSGTDLTEYSGPVNARVVEGSINLTYEVRDDEDDDWTDRERVYSPFETGPFEPMEFPMSLDGDEIVIDYSALDEYNPDWLSPEFR